MKARLRYDSAYPLPELPGLPCKCWKRQCQWHTAQDVKVKGQNLGRITSFRYHGAIVLNEGLKRVIFSRIAQATAALLKQTGEIATCLLAKGKTGALSCHIRISLCL